MTPGRIPRLRAPALTITILLAALALSFALLGSLALADDTPTVPAELPAEDTEATQAAPCTATASTSLRAHQPGDAVDGSKATHWAAISLNYPQWLTVDLGAPQRVVKSSISWLRAKKIRKYFYRLEGSLDGQEWQLLADRTKKSAYNLTNDSLDIEVQYLRITVLGANRGRAGIKEIKVKKDTTEGDEWVVVTPTPEPSPEPTDPGDEWAVVTPTPTPTPTDTATSVSISSLSASHAPAGASITISGTGFGSTQGTSTVTFGERVNSLGFAPVARQAVVEAWSDSAIRLTVPPMSPGRAGYPSTYHNVYVTVGSTHSNSYPFYMDPATVNPPIPGTTRTANARGGYDYVAPSTATSGVQFSGSNLLFENCTFRCDNRNIIGNNAGVLFSNNASCITFLNCTVKSNTGVGANTAGDPGVNAIKLYSDGPRDSGVHDSINNVTFAGCTVEKCSRMGLEIVQSQTFASMAQWGYVPVTRGYYNIAVRDTVFEPQGAEPISFSSWQDWNMDGITDGLDTYSLCENVDLKGGGDWVFPGDGQHHWGADWESNQAYKIECRNMRLYLAQSQAFNINISPGCRGDLLFDNCDFFGGTNFATTYSWASASQGVIWSNLNYTRWRDCDFHYGTYPQNVHDPGVITGNYNDFTGSTIDGRCNWGDYWIATGIGNVDPSHP